MRETGFQQKVTGETKMETTMKCTMGLLNRADGSARLTHGKSEVLVAVFGPMECVRQKDELKDRACVRVVVDPIVGLSGREEKSFQKVLRSMFESVIVTEKFPRMMIKIVVQKIVDEDSLSLSTAINCACLALLDAGVEMRRTLGAVELEIDTLTGKIVHNNGKKSVSIMNEDEELSSSSMCIGFDSDYKIVSSITEGPLTQEQYFSGIKYAKEISKSIFQFYREMIMIRDKQQ